MFVLQRSRPARVATRFLQFSIVLLLIVILHQSATKQRAVEGKFTTEQGGNVARDDPETAGRELDERAYRQESQLAG